MRGSGRTNKKQKEDWPEQWYEAEESCCIWANRDTHKQTK